MRVRFILFLTIIFCFSIFISCAAIAEENSFINGLSSIVSQVVQDIPQENNLSAIGVVDFVDLNGQATTIGKFIAEEFSSSLVRGSNRFQVIDRNYINGIVTQNNFFINGMMPDEIKKLGELARVDAIASGTVVPFSESIRLTVKILSTVNGAIITTKQINIPRTEDISALLNNDASISKLSIGKQGQPSVINLTSPKSDNELNQQILESETSIVAIKAGIRAEINNCLLNQGGDLTCSVIFTNITNQPLRITFCDSGRRAGEQCSTRDRLARNSFIYDNEGNKYDVVLKISNNITKDGRNRGILENELLLPGVPLKLEMFADKFTSINQKITLSIITGRPWKSDAIVENYIFNDVPVIPE